MAKKIDPAFVGKKEDDFVYVPPYRTKPAGMLPIFKVGRDYVYVGHCPYDAIKFSKEDGTSIDYPYRRAFRDEDAFQRYAARRATIGSLVDILGGMNMERDHAALAASDEDIEQLKKLVAKWGIEID